jgi:2-phospho-L-lactate guanylyltransferase
VAPRGAQVTRVDRRDGFCGGPRPYDPAMSRDADPSHTTGAPAQVLIPVKAFDRAKQRLAGHLEHQARSRLARKMADAVLAAARPLAAVVVCDDDEVAGWAREAGASVCWTPGCDLNEALSAAVDSARANGVARVVIAHADLPFAGDLARFAGPGTEGVVIVSDRHGIGTNVMSLPTDPRFELSYGPGSADLHAAAARAAGLEVREVTDEALGWDVDEPADLQPPPHLGGLPITLDTCRPGAGS